MRTKTTAATYSGAVCVRGWPAAGAAMLCYDCRPARTGNEDLMPDEALLNRITANPKIFGGKPIIRGLRISVEMIVSLLAQGETTEAILEDYPDLEPEDIRACLTYAHAVIAEDRLEAI